MRQYTSNYGSQNPELLIQAINLGIKLFLLQKKKRVRWGGGRICWWFGFLGSFYDGRNLSIMGLRQPHMTESLLLSTRLVKGLALSVFPWKLSLAICLEQLYFKNKIFAEKNGAKWEEMNIDDEHQCWQEISRTDKSTMLGFVGFLTSQDLVMIYSIKIKMQGGYHHHWTLCSTSIR